MSDGNVNLPRSTWTVAKRPVVSMTRCLGRLRDALTCVPVSLEAPFGCELGRRGRLAASSLRAARRSTRTCAAPFPAGGDFAPHPRPFQATSHIIWFHSPYRKDASQVGSLTRPFCPKD